jgi:hypothetical protein
MPRPLVEVRQTVLNPVVTVNDPVQQVCLIGLHVNEKTDVTVNTLDRLSAIAAADDLHVLPAAAANQSFDIKETGVIINTDIDMGPDQFDLDGDLSIKFSSADISRKTLNNFNNAPASADDAAIVYDTSTINLAAELSDVEADALSTNTLSVVCKPLSTYFNKLVLASGTAIDFVTGAVDGNILEINTAISNLNVGDIIQVGTASLNTAGNITCKILRIDSDAIYVCGTNGTQNALLVDSTALNLYPAIEVGTAAIGGSKFKLTYAGTTESKVLAIDGAKTKLTLETRLPFVSHNSSDGADKRGKGVLLQSLSSAELASYEIAETDGTNPLAVTSDTTGNVTMDIAGARLHQTISGVNYQIVRATMTSSYSVALNSNSTQVVTVDSNTLASTLGSTTPRNQLAVAANLALLNSGGSSVGVLALDLSPAEGETAAKSLADAYAEALVILNKNINVYAMVPLTQNLTTTKTYSAAAEAMSMPKKGKFRICLGTGSGAPLVDYIIGSETSPSTTGSISGGNISDVANAFRAPSSKVLAGDAVIATHVNAGVTTTYTGSVTSVTNTLLTITWVGVAPANITTYYVSRSLANRKHIARQIEILKAEASSASSKRLFLTFPGKCSITVGETTYSSVPAYFVTAAFSGVLTRLEIHRPKNFIGLAGIVALEDFSRFSDDQLDEISDAGYLVFQQREATSVPFCVHQVNTYHGTSAGTQEFTELSVIANYDFVSRYFKEILDPFAGTMNIVPSTYGIIRASIESGIMNLQSRRVSTIGAPLLTGSIDYVRQASYDQGTIEASVSVTIPKVLNKLILEVVSG